MALVKGPFKFRWGGLEINNISEISVDYTVDTSDTTTLDGNRYSVQTGMGMTVSLTVLENDITALAALLPQYYVSGDAGDATLSTGETVTAANGGAIDLAAASCNTSEIYSNLEIISCGPDGTVPPEDQAQVLRLVRARTQVDSIDISDGLRTVTVMFVGEPASGQGIAQFYSRAAVPQEEPAPATP